MDRIQHAMVTPKEWVPTGADASGVTPQGVTESAAHFIRRAVPYTWNAQMTNLLVERARMLHHDATVHLDDLPSAVGFAWFETPIDGTHGWLWFRQPGPWVDLFMVAFARETGLGVPLWMPSGSVAVRETWGVGADPFSLDRLFATSALLLNERITYATREVPRHMLSRKQRKQPDQQRPIVRVVELRTITRTAEAAASEQEQREFHHQWMVRAHTRRLRRRDTGEEFTVPVKAHRKGPKEAPWLQPQGSIFLVDR
jgi:hypothetical protein